MLGGVSGPEVGAKWDGDDVGIPVVMPGCVVLGVKALLPKVYPDGMLEATAAFASEGVPILGGTVMPACGPMLFGASMLFGAGLAANDGGEPVVLLLNE